MWLINSSIGKKVLMSLTGLFLVLFLAFHACMNFVAVFSLEAYDAVCGFLGANWYAVVGTLVLAGGLFAHFGIASKLSISNGDARGQKYEVEGNAPGVEWASKNMFVLGLIVLIGAAIHLYMFWSKMMFAELAGIEGQVVNFAGAYGVNEVTVSPTEGGKLLLYWFSQPVMVILYLVWLVAIWFHLSHGVWSAFHTIGLNNNVWLCRWKMIANVVATILMLMFAFVVVYFFVLSLMNCECAKAYLLG